MGTNYDAVYNRCECCGRAESVHIGKSSAGWRFAVEMHPELYKDWQEFEAFLRKEGVEIVNEYGEKCTPQELLERMEDKKDGQSHVDPSDRYRKVVAAEFADLCYYEFS